MITQIRIHNAKNSDFYIFVASKPTIEDCENLRFAPFAFQYPDLETAHLKGTSVLCLLNGASLEHSRDVFLFATV